MMQNLHDAVEEIKRAEHQIYVSLKYTRTVDVIINILQRMVDGYSLLMDSLLFYAVENKLMPEAEMPVSAIEKARKVEELFKDEQDTVDNVELYLLMRKLLNVKTYERENEYRRHVTMKTIIDNREEIVNIDIITNYYLFQREFAQKVQKMVGVKNEDLMRDENLYY